MYLLKRQKASGAFNVKPSSRGGYKRMMRDRVEGYGIGMGVYTNSSTHSKRPVERFVEDTNHLRVKPSKPRKYISLNL